MTYCFDYGYGGFHGQTLRQRLLGYARAVTRVAVVSEGVTNVGRVVAVDAAV